MCRAEKRSAFRRMDTFKKLWRIVFAEMQTRERMRSIYILTSGGRRYAFPPYADSLAVASGFANSPKPYALHGLSPALCYLNPEHLFCGGDSLRDVGVAVRG
ncbi:hypothetical protein AGMMS50256_04380 [Betaproteobacteria bacterium]|nr:hypothetical protein AGMMS50256_04380 [Betaproteobacteria bacterium]